MAGFRKTRKRTFSDSKPSEDDPPNSRLFILCNKQLTERDFREAFSDFGEIEDIWVVKNRSTGEPKGVVYIKYKKTSQAAAALEAMHGKVIGNATKHIKVVVASNRDQGSTRDENEEEKILRLFVIIPKSMTEEELYNEFKVYGDIQYATVVMDKMRNESKGFGYIKFRKFSQAAAAYEQCDPKYRAVFAEPRKPRRSEIQDNYSSDNYYNESSRGVNLPDTSEKFISLQVISSPELNQGHIWKLFDIIPGMDYCQSRLEGDLQPECLVTTVVYNSSHSASRALDKLHGFEYPIGSRIIVKPKHSSYGFGDQNDDYHSNRWEEHHNVRAERYVERRDDYNERRGEREMPRASGSRNSDFARLAETIAKATDMIKAATRFSPSDILSPSEFESEELQCSVRLPNPKPILNSETEIQARCFIVCSHPLPPYILRDVFCRFGSLIDVYLLHERNCGYAVYASRQSASNAMQTLHGAEVAGVRLKVLEADEPGVRKRMRFNNSE